MGEPGQRRLAERMGVDPARAERLWARRFVLTWTNERGWVWAPPRGVVPLLPSLPRMAQHPGRGLIPPERMGVVRG